MVDHSYQEQGGESSVSTLGAGRRNLGQVITEEVLRMVREGELQTGDTLPSERELMERYSVGRNTIREAIQALVALNVLEVRPRLGARVRGLPGESALDRPTMSALLNDQAVSDLYELRALLEAEIAAKAALRCSDDQLRVLGESLDTYRSALAAGEPVYQADIDFHRALAAAGGNAVYGRILDALADLLVAARRLILDRIPEVQEATLREHEAILTAIKAGNEEQARAAMSDHIAAAARSLIEARRRELTP
jgi:GntR family transcriptional repressor for pyruvate dehydrogenase complex